MVARDAVAVVDDTRVGFEHAGGVPVALVVMIGLVLAAGVAIVASTQSWF